jgi:hypothetical protein
MRCDDGIGGIGLRRRNCAQPTRRQSIRPDLILILDGDGTSGLLDVAEAPGFIEIQQQEVTAWAPAAGPLQASLPT